MAYSPAHQFGQIIGLVLEKAVLPGLDAIAQASNLYLDRKGDRPARQKKKKVCWLDLYGNSHDLDFVLERHGTDKIHGVPVAFVECAWRRYTKHSKNKVQEIQGAISPLSDKYECHAPFIGVILAGDYTKPAVEQLRSLHYQVVHIKYKSVIAAFKTVGIDASYGEATTDAQMRNKLAGWKGLSHKKQDSVASTLQLSIKSELDEFNDELQKAIDRHITKVIVLPLHGCVQECTAVDDPLPKS